MKAGVWGLNSGGLVDQDDEQSGPHLEQALLAFYMVLGYAAGLIRRAQDGAD